MGEQTTKEHKSRLRGELLCPGDDSYEEARIIHNGMINKRPALIVRCTGAADVIDAVNFASDNNLLVAVRGGGHSVAGSCICNGGIMIDLSLLRGVQVDPTARIARVQGGATLGDLDRETQAFGLAAPVGTVSTTGVAGLTLGGGFGWLRAKHGLTIDNLLSVDIVTANGQFRRASESENSDLFWAVRGGGGNFGIVTSFEFRLHPVGPIVMFCGPMYPAERSSEVMRSWRDFMASAPDEFTSELLFWIIPAGPHFPPEIHGKPVVIPAGVYAGSVEEGKRFVQPLRKLGTPILDLSGPKPFTAVQSSFDPFFQKGEVLHYWKSLYLDSLSDDVIDTLVAAFADHPPSRALFILQDLRGASTRVAPDATAFGDRSAPYLLELNSSWTDPQESERNIAWTRQLWADMRRFSSGGLYLNMVGFGEEGEDLVRKTYGNNYDRLRDLKKKYDPKNLFHLNQNIKPKA